MDPVTAVLQTFLSKWKALPNDQTEVEQWPSPRFKLTQDFVLKNPSHCLPLGSPPKGDWPMTKKVLTWLMIFPPKIILSSLGLPSLFYLPLYTSSSYWIGAWKALLLYEPKLQFASHADADDDDDDEDDDDELWWSCWWWWSYIPVAMFTSRLFFFGRFVICCLGFDMKLQLMCFTCGVWYILSISIFSKILLS